MFYVSFLGIGSLRNASSGQTSILEHFVPFPQMGVPGVVQILVAMPSAR